MVRQWFVGSQRRGNAKHLGDRSMYQIVSSSIKKSTFNTVHSRVQSCLVDPKIARKLQLKWLHGIFQRCRWWTLFTNQCEESSYEVCIVNPLKRAVGIAQVDTLFEQSSFMIFWLPSLDRSYDSDDCPIGNAHQWSVSRKFKPKR